jgi:hypothetical protein
MDASEAELKKLREALEAQEAALERETQARKAQGDQLDAHGVRLDAQAEALAREGEARKEGQAQQRRDFEAAHQRESEAREAADERERKAREARTAELARGQEGLEAQLARLREDHAAELEAERQRQAELHEADTHAVTTAAVDKERETIRGEMGRMVSSPPTHARQASTLIVMAPGQDSDIKTLQAELMGARGAEAAAKKKATTEAESAVAAQMAKLRADLAAVEKQLVTQQNNANILAAAERDASLSKYAMQRRELEEKEARARREAATQRELAASLQRKLRQATTANQQLEDKQKSMLADIQATIQAMDKKVDCEREVHTRELSAAKAPSPKACPGNRIGPRPKQRRKALGNINPAAAQAEVTQATRARELSLGARPRHGSNSHLWQAAPRDMAMRAGEADITASSSAESDSSDEEGRCQVHPIR